MARWSDGEKVAEGVKESKDSPPSSAAGTETKERLLELAPDTEVQGLAQVYSSSSFARSW